MIFLIILIYTIGIFIGQVSVLGQRVSIKKEHRKYPIQPNMVGHKSEENK